MTTLIAVALLLLFFALMAAGLIFAKKTLKRGCSLGADCTCKKNSISPEDCKEQP